MATLKHIASKNSDYTAIEAYLIYQHDAGALLMGCSDEEIANVETSSSHNQYRRNKRTYTRVKEGG